MYGLYFEWLNIMMSSQVTDTEYIPPLLGAVKFQLYICFL